MAKLRRNHISAKKSKGGMASGRLIIFGMSTIVVMVLLGRTLQNINWKGLNQDLEVDVTMVEDRFYLPSSEGEIVHHEYYSLSYVEKWEQAEWVAYELNANMLNGPRVKRTKYFKQDPMVSTKSSREKDFVRSGFTRGHLVPAADMAFNEIAMRETFYTSNISPQKRNCNGGIWRELEENVRDWAIKHGSLYIVSGPILNPYKNSKLQGSNISVPKNFFKIILTANQDEPQGIGFVIKNSESEDKLNNHMVTIDYVEKLTGIDFFHSLLDEQLEHKVESEIDVTLWTIDSKRYQRRILNWNN